MTKVAPSIEKDLSRKFLVLRFIYKAFILTAFLSIIYIFTIGFFSSSEPIEKKRLEFDLSTVNNESAVYFKMGKRELLTFKNDNKLTVFWANDPIYGCKLEFFNTYIKPVCIDIKYNLTGFNENKNQQLTSPEYEVNQQNELIVYY